MSRNNGNRDPDDEIATPEIPNFLQMSTQTLLEEFGAGRHKPGSGSAAALLGLLACKMMQTVITVTHRNSQYAANFSQLNLVDTAIKSKYDPFFRDAVQRDSAQFDRYHRAIQAKKSCTEPSELRRLTDKAREELRPATEIPLEIARHALEISERGLVVYDLGARHARGDSGVAISAALSACSGALFVVYLNLSRFREGQWALATRTSADEIKMRSQELQHEQFRRVSRIQAEGIEQSQQELPLQLEFPDEDSPT